MYMRNEAVEKLQEIISESSSIVFFGGAGVSTESGIAVWMVCIISSGIIPQR